MEKIETCYKQSEKKKKNMLHSSANCIFAYKFSLTQRHQTSKPKHHLVQIMVPKALLFTVMLLAFAAESAPSAQAQLLGLGQLLINGTVYCSTGPVTATTPVFPSKIRFSQALHFSSAKVLKRQFYLQMLECSCNVGVVWLRPRLQTLTGCSACK